MVDKLFTTPPGLAAVQVRLPPRDRPAVRSIPSSAGRDPGTPRPARKTDIWPPAGNTPGTSRKYVRDGNAVRIALPPKTRGAPPLPGVNPAQLRKLCRFSSALEPRSLLTTVNKLFTRLAEPPPYPTGFTGLRRSLACTGNPTKVCLTTAICNAPQSPLAWREPGWLRWVPRYPNCSPHGVF